MPTELDPTGNPVEIEGLILRTPGLEGYAEGHRAGAPGMRAITRTTDELEQAMANEGLRAEESLELGGTNEIDLPIAGTRSTSHAEPAIELEVPAPSPDWGQLVLASDEAGVVTWNYAAEESAGSGGLSRGAGRRNYVIRRYVARPESGEARTRGLIGAIGKKILKVVAFKLLDPIGAKVGDYFAGKWEAAKRPYRFRPFTPYDYTSAEVNPIGGADWETLSRGRSLLMVHGTTSRAHTAFGSLPFELMEELYRRYQGRVFAFDHFTLSEDPRRNVDWFLSHMPADQHLDIDILCHSRGGLVSRVLAERQSELSLGSRQLRVGTIVFAAVPNAGTMLADPRYMGDFVDAYTNLLNFIPGVGIVDVLEGIITVVKQLAVGALKGLDGLQAMNPTGDFLRSLNDGPVCDTRYYAVAADFEPAVPGFKAYALDRLTDKIFREHNDVVVPTEGVYRRNGRGGFPIDERFVFEPTAGVAHTNLFGQPKLHEQLLTWLQ